MCSLNVGTNARRDPMRLPITVSAASILLAATMPAPGRAADASGWDGTQPSAVRLIAAAKRSEQGRAILRAGVQIRLAPGWKTYWRSPGDAGVPPQFEFAGSENVKAITVLWPAPERFLEDGVTLIAYKGDVTFPLHVVSEDVGKPVVLRLQLAYGICEKVCMPVQAKGELVLTGAASVHEDTIANAEARVPKLTALGEGQTLGVRAIAREVGRGRSRVIVDVAAPRGERVDVFAEGPSPDWSLPLLEANLEVAGLERFVFGFDPPDPRPEAGWQLKFTVVTDRQAIEVSTSID